MFGSPLSAIPSEQRPASPPMVQPKAELWVAARKILAARVAGDRIKLPSPVPGLRA